MASMVVIYNTPKDPAFFEKHYFETHIPLAKTLPGLRKYEVSNGPIDSPTGATGIYKAAVLTFDSMDAIREAFASPEGLATYQDRLIYAPNNSDLLMLLFDSEEV